MSDIAFNQARENEVANLWTLVAFSRERNFSSLNFMLSLINFRKMHEKHQK